MTVEYLLVDPKEPGWNGAGWYFKCNLVGYCGPFESAEQANQKEKEHTDHLFDESMWE